MSAFRRMFALALVCLCLTTLSAAQVSDQVVATRVLGPHWRQISRTSGMIFSGTVLGVEGQPAGNGRPLPLIRTKFRVDRAIAGVHAGQILTVREWSGAWAAHRAMRGGERLLIFLYPLSRLGLTSPVGGRQGQVALDARGEIVAPSTSGAEALDQKKPLNAALKRCTTEKPKLANCAANIQPGITLRQLERAIRNARNDEGQTINDDQPTTKNEPRTTNRERRTTNDQGLKD